MAHRKSKKISSAKKVLIVDDEKAICDCLSAMLSKHGIASESANKGNDAISKLKENSVDAVLLDFSLPDIDGLKVLEEIRRSKPKLPVIFMTGYGSETVTIKAFKLGISDYFIKPFNIKQLIRATRESIGESIEEEDHIKVGGRDIEKDMKKSRGISRVVQHIKSNYHKNIPLEDASEIAGISKFHFTRSFKQIMGISFKDYLNTLRIKKAEELISEKNLSISDLAYKNGFNSLRQFERAFKKATGKTPLQARKEKAN